MEERGGPEVPPLAEVLLAAAGNVAPGFFKDGASESQPLLQDMTLYTGTGKQSKTSSVLIKSEAKPEVGWED